MNKLIPRRCLALVFSLLGVVSSLRAGPAFFEENFNSAAAISQRWNGTFTTEAYQGGLAVVINSPSTAGNVISTVLDHATLKGRRVVITAQVKSTNLSTPPQTHNGIKIMLKYQLSSGTWIYPQVGVSPITAGWDHVYKVVILPEDVIAAVLVLGLENVSGTVAFDDVRIEANPVVFASDFNVIASIPSIWTGSGVHQTEVNGTGNALKITHATASTTYRTAVLSSIQLNQIKGRRVILRGSVKATNVVAAAPTYNGIKVMLQVTIPGDAVPKSPQADVGRGTFEWAEVDKIFTVPANATAAKIIIGLEVGSGTVCFDNIHLDLIDDFPTDWVNPTPGHTGHNPAFPLRGMMVGTGLTVANVNTLTSWNVNLVRWQLGATSYPTGLSTANYTTVLNAELAKLDAMLPYLTSAGIKVVVDLHTLSMKQFDNELNQNRLIATWKTIASKYKNNATVWGYDIANEPVEPTTWFKGALLNWNELAERVALGIREADPTKTIIVESTEWASPSAMAWQRPVRANNIVYSIHYYLPHNYTHYRVNNDTDSWVTYPGSILIPGTTNNEYWDKNKMRATLAPVLDFQDAYDVHVYVGEFSAVRWVPGAATYLTHLVELFEEYGWDWTYHAFADWHGWKAELGEVKTVATPPLQPTARELLLKSKFGQNLRPAY